MNNVDVQVKGFNLYCEDDEGTEYDLFVPKDHYRMFKNEAREYIPETHKLIDIKRNYITYRVDHDNLKSIAQKI